MQSRCSGWSDLPEQDYSNPCKLFLRFSYSTTHPGLACTRPEGRPELAIAFRMRVRGRNAQIVVSSNSQDRLGWLLGYFDKNGPRVRRDQGMRVWDSKCAWYNLIQCLSQSYKVLVKHLWTIDDNSDNRNTYYICNVSASLGQLLTRFWNLWANRVDIRMLFISCDQKNQRYEECRDTCCSSQVFVLKSRRNLEIPSTSIFVPDSLCDGSQLRNSFGSFPIIELDSFSDNCLGTALEKTE